MALLGAASVLAVSAVASCTHSTSGPAASSAVHQVRPVSAARSSATRAPTSSPIDLGGWRASAVAGAASHTVPVFGDAGSLYTVGRQLFRLDARSGAVLAHRTVPDTGGFAEPVLVDGTLWLAPLVGRDGSARLQGYDPSTLQPTASIALGRVRQDGVLPLAGAPASDRIFLALHTGVRVVDVARRHVIGDFPVSGGQVVDVAVNAAQSRLYVAVDHGQDQMASRIDVLSPATGAVVLSRDIADATVVDTIGLVASTGGLWVETGGGMQDHVSFFRGTDLHAPPTGATARLDGRPLTVTTTGGPTGTVWLAGGHTIVCADPRTGAERAHTDIPVVHGSSAFMIDVQRAGSMLVGAYDAGTGTILTRFAPDVRCDQ